jgi:hypothetical protein
MFTINQVFDISIKTNTIEYVRASFYSYLDYDSSHDSKAIRHADDGRRFMNAACPSSP